VYVPLNKLPGFATLSSNQPLSEVCIDSAKSLYSSGASPGPFVFTS